MRGVFNIVIGLALVAGGLSGKFVLWGTESGLALAAVGLIPIGIGIHHFWQVRQRRQR